LINGHFSRIEERLLRDPFITQASRSVGGRKARVLRTRGKGIKSAIPFNITFAKNSTIVSQKGVPVNMGGLGEAVMFTVDPMNDEIALVMLKAAYGMMYRLGGMPIREAFNQAYKRHSGNTLTWSNLSVSDLTFCKWTTHWDLKPSDRYSKSVAKCARALGHSAIFARICRRQLVFHVSLFGFLVGKISFPRSFWISIHEMNWGDVVINTHEPNAFGYLVYRFEDIFAIANSLNSPPHTY
jgi:hypothetical protein